jgi:lipopolysaccharide/colanic/teichoic acid biosynthesis glycosyltransferase
MLLPLVLPLMAVLFVLVALDGGRPVFSHSRVGKDGRIFHCYKVRTMVLNAEERLEEILKNEPAAAKEWAEDFKLRNDPRITRIGRFLRKTSLDELPQLWNVLRGDMSLVGPRPVTEPEMQLYGRDAGAYCSVSPGVTGIWQVSGRNSLSFDERVALDNYYATHLSLREDLRILFMTVPAVLHATGL